MKPKEVESNNNTVEVEVPNEQSTHVESNMLDEVKNHIITLKAPFCSFAATSTSLSISSENENSEDFYSEIGEYCQQENHHKEIEEPVKKRIKTDSSFFYDLSTKPSWSPYGESYE